MLLYGRKRASLALYQSKTEWRFDMSESNAKVIPQGDGWFIPDDSDKYRVPEKKFCQCEYTDGATGKKYLFQRFIALRATTLGEVIDFLTKKKHEFELGGDGGFMIAFYLQGFSVHPPPYSYKQFLAVGRTNTDNIFHVVPPYQGGEWSDKMKVASFFKHDEVTAENILSPGSVILLVTGI